MPDGVRHGLLPYPPPVHADEIPAELDRVGAGFRKADAADYISVQLGLDEVKILGPPRE